MLSWFGLALSCNSERSKLQVIVRQPSSKLILGSGDVVLKCVDD
jgi:hypothetical protein